MNLRFVIKNGEKVLQREVKVNHGFASCLDWQDVPTVKEPEIEYWAAPWGAFKGTREEYNIAWQKYCDKELQTKTDKKITITREDLGRAWGAASMTHSSIGFDKLAKELGL